MGRHHHQGLRAEPAEGGRPFLAAAVAAEPELRRDLSTVLQLGGISPRRYSGWEPPTRTRYHYDADGRLVGCITTREPEWDEIDRALIDAYLNWKGDLHVCGRPLTESLHDDDSDEPDPDYQVAVETCRACMALDRDRAQRAEADKALRDVGRNPETWRLETVLPLDELPPADRAAILDSRTRRNPEQT